MYSTNSIVAARRSAAAVGAAVALTAGAVAFGSTAQAAPFDGTDGASGAGKATATVLRTGLDVSLLDKTVDVPLAVTLNDVHAPAAADKTVLSVTLDGVDHGRPFDVLRADVATAKATADRKKSEGYANLVDATVRVPGLTLLALIKADVVTSTATCEVGRQPTASSVLAGVTVLGKRIDVRANAVTTVNVPAVGEVGLEVSKTVTTSRTAAATALRLNVHVNPLNLNVAEVTGTVTLARATCEMPQSGGSSTGGSSSGGGGSSTGGSSSGGSPSGGSSGGGTSGGSNSGGTSGGSSSGGPSSGGSSAGTSGSTGSGGTTNGGSGAETQTGTGTGDLAHTGSSSSTPYLAAGAAVLVLAGGGATYLASRRRRPATEAGSQD